MSAEPKRQIVMASAVCESLREAGIIPSENFNRLGTVTIELKAGEAARVRCDYFGDTRLIEWLEGQSP